MKNHLLKGFLIIALLFMSNYALAVPVGGSKEEDNFILFSLLAFPVIVVWFSINAAVALIEKRSNLDSLYFSSASMLCCFIICLKNALTVYDYTRWENINAISVFSGILLIVLIINIIAIKKLKKRQKEKEIEE